ncbi:metal-dependent hydrolase [Texcoconibacillus texcoconensis]|uniref:Inner membrane protein n=1 Tax=Texcoconibacillus texcoconensis TaxID=1095777 RepID=A0A840QQP6_9BACI|nr:metal-dependent hydrolase [Texcoconibacillus texcoconensis]MBB5173669.1 inner membrane protein [Texcoconibacillus texcoconensis]
MTGHSHVVTSLTLGAVVTFYDVGLDFSWSFAIGIAIGSLLPDIDEPKSFIGRKCPFVSNFLKRVFGHRGLTHSALITAIIFMVSEQFDSTIISGLAYGYLFHVLGDFFSRRGVALLAPLSKKRFAAPITYKTNGWGEKMIAFVCYLFWIYWLFDILRLSEISLLFSINNILAFFILL